MMISRTNLISTHTLTWSVTDEYLKIDTKRPNFNSHAHVERDLHMLSRLPHLPHFNSHAHVERDDIITIKNKGYAYFNSHAHVERDLKKSVLS